MTIGKLSIGYRSADAYAWKKYLFPKYYISPKSKHHYFKFYFQAIKTIGKLRRIFLISLTRNLTLILIRVLTVPIINARNSTPKTIMVFCKIGAVIQFFVNPPYGAKSTSKWIRKCAEESSKPNTTVVMLIPARTDTIAFHKYIYGKAEICFIKGRLKFGGSKNSAPFPSMLVIFTKKGEPNV